MDKEEVEVAREEVKEMDRVNLAVARKDVKKNIEGKEEAREEAMVRVKQGRNGGWARKK
jgi:hypothetical protein